MMQKCFYKLRYISNWTFFASARIYEICNVNAFGAELTRGWHILLHISTIYHAVHSIMELKKTNLFYWNTKLHATFYTSRSKFICFPYPIYPYRYSTIWVWKFARTVTTTVTSTVFIKLTSRFVILVASVSCRLLDCSKSVRRSVISWWWLACRQKGVNLFHNILLKN